MSERKNIFLIGRRGHEGDEDQLTEMLAFLWQERPDALDSWLRSIGLASVVVTGTVTTQFTLPSGKRPDIRVVTAEGTTLVESKLGSGFGRDQVDSYLSYLGEQGGRRALVLLTQRHESVDPRDDATAQRLGVRLILRRWQEVADDLGEPGEETLAGDFIQLLIREGLVKPDPLRASDWNAWNAGYNVELRLDALLAELDPHVVRLLPGSKGRSGASKLWTWRVWSSKAVDIGLAFLAAEWADRPHTAPVAHCWVLNRLADEDAKLRAVNVRSENRSEWRESSQLRGALGLSQFGPAVARPAEAVLHGDSFDEQVVSASDFIRETFEHFRARGYLPVER